MDIDAISFLVHAVEFYLVPQPKKNTNIRVLWIKLLGQISLYIFYHTRLANDNVRYYSSVEKYMFKYLLLKPQIRAIN